MFYYCSIEFCGEMSLKFQTSKTPENFEAYHRRGTALLLQTSGI